MTRHRAGAAPRFGLNIHTTLTSGADPRRVAREAEALGFDLVTIHGDVLAGPGFELWTLLTWLAASTSTVTLAPDVLVVPNRHPVLVAKMATTLERLSGGRLVLALGAGAPMNRPALASLGLGAWSSRDVVAAVDESIRVLRGLWRGEPVSSSDRTAELRDVTLAPVPARGIPIWLGAYGPRMLELTGRRADGWIPSAFFLPPEATGPAIGMIEAAARDAGRATDELTFAYNVGVLVRDGAPQRPGHVVGGVEQVASGLARLLGSGFDVLSLWPAEDTPEQRALLATTVIPAVREQTA